MTLQAIAAAKQIVAHVENFGGPVSTIEPRRTEDETDTKLLRDPSQDMQLVSKLLEQQRTFLKSLMIIIDRNLEEVESKAGSSDLTFCFLADATRELQRALGWYLDVMELWE